MKKKVFALTIALVMLIALALPIGASAATPQFGTLIITISGSNTLDGLTFDLYKVFDVRTNDATPPGYTYTIDPAFAAFTPPTGFSSLRAYLDHVGTLAVSPREAALRDLGDDLDAWITSRTIAPVQNGTNIAGTGQSTTIPNLPAGYYLIRTTVNNNPDISEVRLALVPVSQNAPFTLNISRKIEAPFIDKAFDVDGPIDKWTTAKIGDVIPYDVTATIPGDIAEYGATSTYKIIDTFSHLTYVNNSISVRIAGATSTAYTVNYDPATKELVIDFSVNNFAALIAAGAGAEIEIKYRATLDSTAFINDEGTGNINDVKIRYGADPDSEAYTPPITPPRVYTFGLNIKKFTMNGTNEVLLQGAEFQLYSVADGVTTVPQGATPLWFVLNPAGQYVLSTQDAAGATQTLISAATGMMFVRGLNVGQYLFVETRAPAGYVLLDFPLVINIAHTSGNGVPVVTRTYGSGQPEVDGPSFGVLNNRGSIFPDTGGIGTTIFYIVGGLVMVGAVVTLVVRKRVAVK